MIISSRWCNARFGFLSVLAIHFMQYVGHTWWTWNTQELGHVLNEEDGLHKTRTTIDSLSLDELSRSVMMHKDNIPVDFLVFTIKSLDNIS